MRDAMKERAIALVRRLLDPEDLGLTVTAEVRDAARNVLGHAPAEVATISLQCPNCYGLGAPPGATYVCARCRGAGIVDVPRAQFVRSGSHAIGQTRFHSFIESLTNVAIGYFVALLSQLAIFPLFGIHVPLSTNIQIGLWFTAVSVVRSYVIRRWFNGFRRKT